MPFSDFQQDVLRLCGCAPSQLHSNSWAIIRGFELLCSFLDFPISTRVFFYFFNFAISYGACGQGFLSFQANHNHRIFKPFEESYHGFKEKYFKVERVPGSQPFFMTLEDEKRFNLYWNFHVTSPKIELKSVNPIERDIVHTLLGLWNDNPLDLRMILAEVQASKNVVVKMAGGTEAITAMRRRLGTNTIPTNTEGMDMIYSSATHSNLSPPEPQKSALNIEILYSHPPSSSLVRKKQKSKGKRLMKSTTTQGEDLRSYGCVLKKDFRYCDFVDSFLLIEATKSKSVEMPVEDTLPRIQKMLLGSVAFVRDVEKEIPSFRSKIASKEKELQTSATQIQILNTTLASLQEDNRKLQESIKYLREDKKTSASQVKDLMIKVVEIEKNNSTLAKTAENAE
ncbi:uncharacterized protein LOC107464666 isoform X1 [Arachis duranensis]|uniref:Uncharacterized protein LOC107464666 isoform X1 n=2 Tax=Arachis duranensis TaxID=130453 RepID=A0A6P4BAC4_ARADU|nr:uncharacterized protein LOC107464666 isoform X1 [Arachis duranensis]